MFAKDEHEALLQEMYDEGLRIAHHLQCSYCRRWFSSEKGKKIHLHYCNRKKLCDALQSIRKQNVSIIFTTPNNYVLPSKIIKNPVNR